MLWSVDSCQNSVSADHYRLTVSRAQVSTHWVRLLFWNYPLLLFKWSQAHVSIFLKCMWNKLCSWAAPLKFGFQTDLGRENSSREGSRFWLFSPLSRVGHALLLIFMLWLVKIWQVSSCGKCIQHLETCFLIAEAERVLCRQLVTFLTVFFHWMYKMNTAAIKILL